MSYKVVSEITKRKMSDSARASWRKRGRKVMNLTTGAIYERAADAAKAVGVSPASMCNHLAGRSVSCGGHAWAYCQDLLKVEEQVGLGLSPISSDEDVTGGVR